MIYTGKARRALPDVKQGRLIAEVSEKMETEAKLRNEVAKELREERQHRVRLEDAHRTLQTEVHGLTDRLAKATTELDTLKAALAVEKREREASDLAVRDKERMLKAARNDLAAANEARATATQHARDAEEALSEAWETQRRDRAKIAALRQRLFDMGHPDDEE